MEEDQKEGDGGDGDGERAQRTVNTCVIIILWPGLDNRASVVSLRRITQFYH